MNKKEKLDQNIILAAKVVLTAGNELLLIKRGTDAPTRPGGWDLPGGVVDEGENPYETCIRETHEETGISIVNPQITDVNIVPSQHFNGNTLVMIFTADTKMLEVKLSYEHSEFKWVPLGDTAEYDLQPLYNKTINDLVDKKRGS